MYSLRTKFEWKIKSKGQESKERKRLKNRLHISGENC